ncbi:hypothetical protein F4777DRAFT_499409 [Nemania sp. FL0916]|nr:hypothetical protein F4777DRAFT_499409 [Nemania sp. FL0916]
MSFQFVDNSDINNRARKLIRSHVMKGRNSGKTRTKRTKSVEPTADKSLIAHGTRAAPSNNVEPLIMAPGDTRCKDSILAVTRRVANDLSLLSPIKNMSPQTIFHIRQLAFYILDIASPPEYCHTSPITEWMWFKLTFSNEAYFHCTCGMAFACAAFMTEDNSHSPVALQHMSQAYRLINKQLSSNEALSDSTIAVVAAINVYDRLYGDPQKAMIHHNGLTSIIALRGGIRELAKRNFAIAEKTMRSDVELALHCRSTPRFSSLDIPRHLLLIDTEHHSERGRHKEAELIASTLYQSSCAKLRNVVYDVLCLSKILSQASLTKKLDAAAYQNTLLYIGYRLLETEILPSDLEPNTSLNALIRLAMIGFQNTFCFGIGRKLVVFPPLVEDFRSVAQVVSAESVSHKMIVLWALLMGKVSSLTEGIDDHWLVPKVKTLAGELQFRTWSEVSDALRPFPWVKVTHEAQGEAFWNTIFAQPRLVTNT